MSNSVNSQFKWPIIGHSNIVSYLQNGLTNEKISHAYLFVGPAHIGKSLVAENFVNSLVCDNLKHKNGEVPCGQCQCCKQIENNLHPDIYWVEREVNEKTGVLKKNISIEQIRRLQNKLSLHSFLNSYKIAVINDAQTLSQEAANSLLKTLEEPSPKTVIIVLATSLSKLPPTISSRCQVLKFLPVNSKDIFGYLIKLKVERKKAKILTAQANGLPGIVINYHLNSQDYIDFKDKVKEFINILKSDINYRFKTVSEIVNNNDLDALKNYLVIWNRVLRDLLLIKHSNPNLISNLSLSSDLSELSNSYSSNNLIKIAKEVKLASLYLDANVNPRLTLENLVLNF